MKTGQSVKIVKPKMEAHIACYSSVSTVDLLGKLASETAEKDIWLHWTQRSSLIRQVIGWHMQQEQLKDIKEGIYLALINKQLVIVTWYYTKNGLVFTQYSTSQTTSNHAVINAGGAPLKSSSLLAVSVCLNSVLD